MFGHWAGISSPHKEEVAGVGMTSHSRGRAMEPGSSGRGKGDGKRSGQVRGGDGKGRGSDTWEEMGGDEEEDRPGRLLHQAAIYNNVELLQDLLQGDEKQEVNAADKWGRSPLHTTVIYDSVDCAQLLLTAGADPNRRCVTDRAKHRTPLHVAAREGKCALVRLLLCYGADIEMEDAEGRNAVDLAEAHGHLETQQALLEELSTRLKRRSELEGALFDAFQNNDLEGVRSLLEQLGPTDAARVINSTPSGISTLLYRASHTGSLEMVELLVSHGADGRPHPITRYSPLYVACHTGRIKIAEALVHKFPRLVQVETIEKLFPLHAACFQGHAEIVKLLLQFPYDSSLMQHFAYGSESYVAPFDVNARDMNDQTPLHLACMSGHYEAAKTLLRCRVRPLNVSASGGARRDSVVAAYGRKNTNGSTSSGVSSAVSAAAEARRKLSSFEEEINDALKEPDVEERINDGGDEDLVDVSCANVEVFLQANHLDAANEEKDAASDAAPQSSSVSPSRSPASASPPPSKGFCPVEVDVYTVEGITALHAAVIHGHRDVAELLLKHGADVSLPIKIHPDAMSFAFLSGSHESQERNEKDVSDSSLPRSQLRLTTVLEEAASLGYASMVDLLLTHGASLSSDAEKHLLGRLLKRGVDDVIAVILKYKTHADPEYKVNRKGVLKQMYGPSAVVAVENPQTQTSAPWSDSNGAGGAPASLPASSSNPSTLNAIAPTRPAPLRIPSHPVVVDWHHLHEQLRHVKTSWLETAARVHNPLIGSTYSSSSPTSPTSARDGGSPDASSESPTMGLVSGTLALFAITRLDVSENGIGELPLALFQLNSLKLLNLAYNRISHLPTSFSPSLDDVNLEDSSTSSWCCVCLEEIELQHNNVEEVAEELFALPALQRLNLSHNKIKSLPLQLWKAPSLRELNLSNNQLSYLPIGPPRHPCHPGMQSPKMQHHHHLRRDSRQLSPKKHTLGLNEIVSRQGGQASPTERARARTAVKGENSTMLQALLSPTQMAKSSLFPSPEETTSSSSQLDVSGPAREGENETNPSGNEPDRQSADEREMEERGEEKEDDDESEADTDDQNADSMEEDHVKISPLTHATIWRHKVRADDSWLNDEGDDLETISGHRRHPRAAEKDDVTDGVRRRDSTKSFQPSSQLTTLNLSVNEFVLVPVGLPCLAPKLAKLNLSKNRIVEVGSINSFPSGIKHLDLSGNELETWPIPISETAREDEAYRCFSLNATMRGGGECHDAVSSARHSPDVGPTAKARHRAASRSRHPHQQLSALPNSPAPASSSTSSTTGSSSPVAAPFHSPLSLQHFMMSRYCVHRRHWKLDQLKTLSAAHNRLDRIALSLEDALSSTTTTFSKPEVASALEKKMKAAKSGDEAERERAQTIASIPLNDPDALSPADKKVGSKRSWLLYPNLSHLDISHNCITTVPSTIAELSAITILNLSRNEGIIDLPPEMGLLNKLWNLDLKGIPSLGEPLFTMVSKRYKTTDIVGYLKSILEDAKPYARMKLMFVGIQGIGKTSLLNRLKEEGLNAASASGSHWAERVGADFGQTQQTSGENLSTVGVDLSDWTFEKKGGGRGAAGTGPGSSKTYGPVTFRTWDFGGQREYYATHQYFLSKRSLYLVIWRMTDGVKGLNEIYQWLINIQARAPNSPCIIVGTHFDEIEQKRSLFGSKRREFPEDFQQEMHDLIMSRFVRVLDPEKCGLPKVLGYVEVSCKTRHNVRKLANFIYDSVFDLRSQQGSSKLLLEEKIPATYLALEDVIANIARERRAAKKEPVLLKDQYVTEVLNVMNQKHSVTFRDQAELHQATQFLHDNGVLLHYDDISLKDVYFLDPQWLCDLLAHVVTIREINPFARNGVMKTSALNQLFTSKNHLFFCSQRVHSYILDLLGKFEVALTWDGDHLLIPSMLPPERYLRKGNRDTDIRVPLKNILTPLKKPREVTPVNPSCCCGDDTICLIKDHECCSHSMRGEQSCQDEPPLPACLVKNSPNARGALMRLYLMSYFPSGFWSRLMTRLLADESFGDILKTLFVRVKSGRQPRSDDGAEEGDASQVRTDEDEEEECSNEILDRLAEKVDSERGEWVCWQTGIELRCFDVPVLRIREPQRELNLHRLFNNLRIPQVDYWRPMFHIQGGTTIPNMASASTTPRKQSHPSPQHPIHYPSPAGLQSPEEWHKLDHVSSSSILEVLLPNESLLIKAYKDGKPEVARLSPSQSGLARLLSLAIDHVDNLLEDWYPDLGVRFMVSSQGRFLITRMSPCPACVSSITTKPSKGGGGGNKDEPVDHTADVEGLRNNDLDGGDDVDDDDSWELLDEDFNRKPAVVDLVTLEKQQREAFQNGPSPTSEYDVVAAFDPNNPTKRVCDELHLRSATKVKSDSIFCFMVESLISFSQSSKSSVSCPMHGAVSLSCLAPDLLFHDLPSHMVISGTDVTLGRLLGKGAFGSVFGGAVYKKAHGHTFAVALKMLQPVHPGADATGSQLQQFEMELRRWELEPLRGPCNSYLTARKELGILLHLDHPNIVPLLGICLHPTSLVLSLAPLGALNGLLKDYKRSGVRLALRALQRVILQVAQALTYLHRNMIVYRDLKSENVLAWSLPPPASAHHSSSFSLGGADDGEVLVKLADYGISRASLPSGTKGYAGTDGFMAPEIIRFNGEEAYTEKVDCFSFGMFIYELVSLHRPFEGYEQVKDYVLDRGRPALSKREMSYPTHVLDLMTLCWAHDPTDRPSAEEIAAIAASAEFAHLADATPLDAGEWTSTGAGEGAERRVTCAMCVAAPSDEADRDGGVTDEVWMVLQNVDAESRQPTEDPSPSISVLSFEGHRLVDTLKSFSIVGATGVDRRSEAPSSKDDAAAADAASSKEERQEEEDDDTGEAAASATPTTPTAHHSASPASSLAPPPQPPLSHAIYHVISVLNHVWLCDSSGFVHVYCALGYQPLLSFPVASSSSSNRRSFVPPRVNGDDDASSSSARSSVVVSATRLLFVSAANQVFAALSDGNLVFCNVVAVGQHLSSSLADIDEATSVEHKWLAQTLMQEVHYVGGHGPLTLSMLAIPRRKRVFELWCGQSGKEAQLMVWYMGDMRYKRTLKHQGLKIKSSNPSPSSSSFSEPEEGQLKPWEVGVTLMTTEHPKQQTRAHSDASSTTSAVPPLSSTSVWTYVAPVGKVFRWDVAQKAQVGSIEVDSIDVRRDASPRRSGGVRRSGGGGRGGGGRRGDGDDTKTSPQKSSPKSRAVASLTVMNGVLYLGRADGVIIVADAVLEPGSSSLISIFRPHDADAASLVAIGAGASFVGRKSGAGGEDNSGVVSVKRGATSSYRATGGADNYSSVTKPASGVGGSSSLAASSPPWWVSQQHAEGTTCPLLVSVGRGYRSLISAKCPTAAFSPAAVTQSSGAYRHKTFVLSWYATEWDRLDVEKE